MLVLLSHALLADDDASRKSACFWYSGRGRRRASAGFPSLLSDRIARPIRLTKSTLSHFRGPRRNSNGVELVRDAILNSSGQVIFGISVLGIRWIHSCCAPPNARRINLIMRGAPNAERLGA